MNKSYVGIATFGLLLAAAADVRAAELVLDAQRPTGVSLTMDGLNRRHPALRFSAHVGRLVATEVQTERGRFTELTIPGSPVAGDVGAPALPVLHRLIEVPLGATLKAKVTGRDVQTVNIKSALGLSSPLMPRQHPRPKSGPQPAFAFDKDAYEAPGLQQEELASVEEVGLMRHMRLVLLKIAPVAYEPTTGKLEVFKDVQVELSMEGADMAATQKMKSVLGSPYIQAVARDTLVPETLARLNRPANRATQYLIVADRMFESELKPFIEWKTAKGVAVTVAYTDTIGATAEAIKTHIASTFANATEAAPAPEFVLFVGDHEQVPAHRGTAGGHITDLYHACVNGNDNIPDVLIGRFSAQTVEQLRPQIAKTVEYEQAAFADPSFLQKSVLVAGWDSRFAVEWGYPQINYAADFFFNAANGFTDTKKFLSSSSSQNEPQIVAAVKDGVAFVNYTAHGSPLDWSDPTFSQADIASLNNAGKYVMAVGNCCLTNKFDVSTCFGEAWLRAEGKGAIGYIGGTNSTYWDEDLWWGTGFYAIAHPNPTGAAPTLDQTNPGAYEGWFTGTHATNGGMNLVGNLAVEESTSPRKKYYWEVYTLMGDPSLRTFVGLPQETVAVHNTTATAGATSVDVEAPAGSYVGLTVNGELIGASHIEGGKASVDTKPLVAGTTIKVVVTGRNLRPYTGSIEVGAAR